MKLKIALFFTLFISQITFAEIIIPSYKMAEFDQAIVQLYQNNHSSDLVTRLNTTSEYFLGKPYLEDALGEGPQAQFDQRPLYRTDAFDCVTYVATVLALIESNNLTEFKKNIVKINYKNPPVIYRNRNHFMEIDWNPKNVKNGYLKDITRNFKDKEGKSIAKPAIAIIDKKSWFEHLTNHSLRLFSPISPSEQTQLLNELHREGRFFGKEKSVVWYLPLTVLFDKEGNPNQFLFDQIPTGTIIEIIRPNVDLTTTIGTRMNITHLGFGIRKNNQLFFREASLIENKVIDIPLSDYLHNYLHSPTIKGINVQKIMQVNH